MTGGRVDLIAHVSVPRADPVMLRSTLLTLLSTLVIFGPRAAPALAQGIVVDEGRFAVSVAGEPAGTEEFSIRRSGPLAERRELANGVVRLELSGGRVEIRPVLELRGNDRRATGYEVDVTGPDEVHVAIRSAGRHFVSSYRSAEGEEEREFRARPGTRFLERDVAHLYHYLARTSPGDRIPVIEPLTRSQYVIEVSGVREEELRMGRVTVPARRVDFSAPDGIRSVWYDRQDRVLRVDVPARQYSAVRADLVG